MTNEELLEDLKQLMAANNAALAKQIEASLEEKLETKLEDKLETKLEAKFNEKLREQTEELRMIMDTSFDATQDQLTNHEARITTLETKAA